VKIKLYKVIRWVSLFHQQGLRQTTNTTNTMKTETWEIWNGNEMKKIRVKGATQNIWNVVNVPITKAVAKRLGTLEGWKAQIKHSPRIVFQVA
jgi:hypothetical protein